MHQIIFLGNGPLADSALKTLTQNPHLKLLFHAKTKPDLETVKDLKLQNPHAFCILASFGVLIKSDLLNLFEPEGILNIHPSLLPLYRGPSPIESAILAGDTAFSVSVMKLAPAMDAGPIYYQTTLKNLPLDKAGIYHRLATAGATWISQSLANLAKFRQLAQNSSPSNPKIPQPPKSLFPLYHLQDDTQATYTQKLAKSMSRLTPETDSAETTLRKIVAFQGFPKPKYTFYGQDCIVLSAHLATPEEIAKITTSSKTTQTASPKLLSIKCSDQNHLIIDRLQPLSRKPMDAKSFLNGIK